MPAPTAGAGAAFRPAPDGDSLREALLARVRSATVRAGECGEAERQAEWEAEWEAELAALEAAGVAPVPPDAEEPWDFEPGPLAAPPDGPDAWLADLPGPLLDEYLAATERPAGPEPIAAGFWSRSAGDGAGFASGGVVDALPPGPVLAGLAADAAGRVGLLSDDELIGLLRAARRLSSWSASLELTAAGDLMRRRLAQEMSGRDGMAEHADAEVAAALTLTGRAADQLLGVALALRRLPLTARALAQGAIDLPRVMVIAEEVAGLGDEHVAAVEERVLARAAGLTTTRLRAATRRAVIAADPAAARQRQERAQRDARVERWAEPAGTGALAGRDLPPVGALAADQHISELARALQAAGAAGTMDQLRALVFVALLTGQPIASLLPPAAGVSGAGQGGPGWLGATRDPDAPGFADGPCPPGFPGSAADPGGPRSPADPGGPSSSGSPDRPGSPGAAGSPAGSGGPSSSGSPDRPGSPSAAGSPDGPGSGSPDDPGAPLVGPVSRGVINLTMPLDTWLGLGKAPGEVAGFGPVDAQDCRGMATAMAKHPGTRWCLTITDQGGRPVAHGCARPRRGPPEADARSPAGPGPPRGRDLRSPLEPRPPGMGPTGSAGSSAGTGSRPARSADGAGLSLPAGVAAWVTGMPLAWLETCGCAHTRESAGYRPAPSLRHLIQIRQRRCAFPGCGRPARGCDLDHTVPYESGGRTCECNLAPLCRRHHQAKQTSGWQLDQSRPGVMTWTTPSGRRYATGPSAYPG